MRSKSRSRRLLSVLESFLGLRRPVETNRDKLWLRRNAYGPNEADIGQCFDEDRRRAPREETVVDGRSLN